MYALDDVAADAVNFRAAFLNGQPYKPLYVKLKLVWSCNLRCGMCNHWRWKRDAPLTLPRFKAVIDELAELGCRKIHISGGEPMLYPGLEELMAHMTGHGLKVTMTTNGTLITRNRSRVMAKAGLHSVNISIDSPDRRLHDRIRGQRGAWKRTVKGFRYLRRRMKKGKMRINTVVGRLNYASLVDLPDLAAELGANEINLIPLDEHTGDLHRLKKREIKAYNKHIAPVIAEKSLALGLMQTVEQAYPFGTTSQQIELSKKGYYAHGYYERRPCFAPWTHALIDHLGRVSLCCMLREGPILGDLRRQSFTEIWTGHNYTALRTGPLLPLLPTCRRCDDFLDENRRFAEIVLEQETGDQDSRPQPQTNGAQPEPAPIDL